MERASRLGLRAVGAVDPTTVTSKSVTIPDQPAHRSGRPQSHRFLQTTLAKLSADSTRDVVRTESSDRTDAGPPEGCSACGRDAAKSESDGTTRPGTTSPSWFMAPERRRGLESQKCNVDHGFTPEDLLARPAIADHSHSVRRPVAVEPIPSAQVVPSARKASLDRAVDAPGILGKSWIVPHSEVEHWRQMFREEARECFRAMSEVMDDFNSTHTASRLEEWRRSDKETMVQMQNCAAELATGCSAMREFVHEFSDIGEYGEMKSALGCLKTAVKELSETRQSYAADVPTHAERAVAKVQDNQDHTSQELSNRLLAYAGEHREFRIDQLERWSQIDCQVDKMQNTLDTIIEHIQARYASQTAFEATQRETLLRVEAMVDASHKHAAWVETSLKNLSVTLQKGQGMQSDSIKQHVTSLLLGGKPCEDVHKASPSLELRDGACKPDPTISETASDGPGSKVHLGSAAGADEVELEDDCDEDPASLFDCLKLLRKRLARVEASISSDIRHWQVTANKLWAQNEAASKEARLLQQQYDMDSEQLRKITLEHQELSQELNQTRNSFGALESTLASQAMRRIKDIELRGNIRMNRQTGDVELIRKELEFKKVDPKQAPVAEFKDAEAAAQVARDVAELSGLFNVPMAVEAHMKIGRGGSTEFWETLVKGRAEMLRELLENNGVPTSLTVPAGFIGRQGLNTDCLVVRLEKGIFPADDPKVVGRSPRGRPPK
mmetsp:Transcript_11642/g.31213  ORF Transcript_11642/g.31213 Transcript_11642/m.31213 type:complete len:725 (-) Transcript_11642:96-2270(-)